jgi:glyoxylase-like metal-dependent hydrolase (beta-lactamase superfamily II)
LLAVYQLPVPTPYAVGPVNVYLIKNDPVTLIDVGPGTAKAGEVLKDMLSSLGVGIKEVKRIIITHAHPDHCGLAADIAGDSNATVFIHRLEEKKLRGSHDYFKERLPFVLEAGIPAEVLTEMAGERAKLPRPGLRGAVNVEILADETLVFDGGELMVMHLPGHSPGHVCLYDPERKYFFSGDFLLPHITPNPVLEPDPEQPGKRLPTLKQYLGGLDRVEALDITMVCPGHGGVFSDYKGVIEAGRRHHRFQFDRIMEKLRGRELSTFQLSREIYPNLKGWEVFLGLSEVQAHLDLLTEWGKTYCFKKQGVVYYTNP